MTYKNKITRILFCLVMSFALLFNFLPFSLPALADDSSNYGLDGTKTGMGADKAKALGADKNLPTMAGTIIGVALSFVGIIFFILMIYGGILWMTARGDESQVTKARELIVAAIIGLVIILSAYAITSYLGTELTKT